MPAFVIPSPIRSLLSLMVAIPSLAAQAPGGAQSAAAEPAAGGIRFSADGKMIVYQLLPAAPGDPPQMRIANADGTNDRAIAIVPGTRPQGAQFSPDGSRIVYHSLTGSPASGPKVQLATIALDGSDGRILSETGGFDSEWSPDGKQLVFATINGPITDGSFGVAVINVDGTGLVQLSRDLRTIQSGSWSPNGGRIVFARRNERGTELVIADRDGGNARSLGAPLPEQAAPVWSPDGRSIAFFGGDSADMRKFGPGQSLFVIRSDGSGLRRVLANATGVSSLSFSPDSKRLLFADRRPGRASDIFVMDIDGSNERALVTSDGTDEAPRWSPNGKLIAYQSSTDPRGRRPHVFIMNADGTEVRRIR